MELREIRRYERKCRGEVTVEQLLESDLPIKDVLQIADAREQRAARMRQIMDRRAKEGRRGGILFEDQLAEQFPIPSAAVDSTSMDAPLVSGPAFAAAAEAAYADTVERHTRYPETNGFSPESVTALTRMLGGPRQAAYYLGDLLAEKL